MGFKVRWIGSFPYTIKLSIHDKKGLNMAKTQCCGSGMFYSGSSFEFLVFRIRIQPMLFKHIWNLSGSRQKFQVHADPDPQHG